MSDRPTSADVRSATRQVALLARLGYPLAEGMKSMGEASPWLAALGDDMEAGDSLARAVKRHPRVFSPLYAAMVEAAEASERPDRLITRLSEWLERADEVRRKVRAALFYPLLVVNGLGLELFFLVGFVVPHVLRPLASLSGWTPPAGVTSLVPSGLLPALLLLGLAALDVAALRDGPAAQRVIGAVPWAGRLRLLADQALWARAVGCLLAAGVDLPKALRQAAPVVLIPSLRQQVDEVTSRVERGSTLAEAMAESPVLDPYLAWAAVAGEDREDQASLMLDAADYLDRQVERRTGHALRMTEPWAMLGVGILVALGLLAFWAPFYAGVAAIP